MSFGRAGIGSRTQALGTPARPRTANPASDSTRTVSTLGSARPHTSASFRRPRTAGQPRESFVDESLFGMSGTSATVQDPAKRRGGRGGRPPTAASQSRRPPARSVLKKRPDGAYVDESLFGSSRANPEDEHRRLHQNSKSAKRIWDTGGMQAESVPVRRARASDRLNFDKPVHLPSGPKPDGTRFKKTTTLQGGYGGAPHPKAGAAPHKATANLLQHRPAQGNRPASAPGRQPETSHHASHNMASTMQQPRNGGFKPSVRPAGRLKNSLWEHHPNT